MRVAQVLVLALAVATVVGAYAAVAEELKGAEGPAEGRQGEN